jgi:DNA-binding transcriptional LysR family regulator
MNLTDLQTFVLVAESGTITAAAKQLGVPKSTVSRRVTRLEDALGLELLRRGSRAVALTDHGEVLRARCGPAIRELADVERALEDVGGEPSGLLRVTTATDVGQTVAFARMLKGFVDRYPAIQVELQLSNRLVDLVEEGFDVGMRMHAGVVPGTANLMSRTIQRFTGRIYASPEYLDRCGRPQTVADVAQHSYVAHEFFKTRSFGPWREGGKRIPEPPWPEPTWTVNDFGALVSLGVAGAGLVTASSVHVTPFIADGQLERVLPEVDTEGGAFTLVWPASRHLAPRVRAFIDYVTREVSWGGG